MARGVNGMWPGRLLLALADDVLHLLAHGVERDAERLERLGGDALTLVDETEQDVLGADVVVVEHLGLFLGQDDDTTGSVGESLEHALLLTTPLGRGRRYIERKHLRMPRGPVFAVGAAPSGL